MCKKYIIVFLALLLVSCKKDHLVFNRDYNKSLKVWATFKTASNNSYSYTVTGGSWTGVTYKTMVAVKRGTVVGRTFVMHAPDGQTGEQRLQEQWIESETTLSTHPNGAPARTLDELYTEAKSLLIRRDDAKTYFETKNNGMISMVGYVPNNCADDCFIGTNISEIKAL